MCSMCLAARVFAANQTLHSECSTYTFRQCRYADYAAITPSVQAANAKQQGLTPA